MNNPASIEWYRTLEPDELPGWRVKSVSREDTTVAVTQFDGEYEGDTSFPEWDEAEWTLLTSTDYDGFTLEEWVRRSDGGS